MLEPDVTIGMSLSGALTPAGLGCSSIVPLIKAGFVDWIVATGANLYHDLHFALNYPVRVGSFKMDDTELRNNDIVRVYDVLLGYSDCLMATDEILRGILVQPEFQKEMGTAELHYLLGKYAAEWERKAGVEGRLGAGGGVSRGRALLHLLAGRFHHRHERGGRRAARQQAAPQPLDRRQRNHRLRAGRQALRRQERRWCCGAAAAPRISCCRPSRRSRKCCASRNTGRTISCR